MDLLQRLKQNWKSGITVSLVSIPLSVSLAVASQASPVVGIITAVWAGLIASIFGGSNYNITGPTGALSGILASYAIAHGAAMLPMLAIVAGVMILTAYAFKLERYLVFVPGSAIIGFTLGVAFIISLNQMNFAFGLSGLEKHEHFIENVIESVMHIPDMSILTFGLFAILLASLFILMKLIPKIPPAIIVAPIAILLGYLSINGIIPIHLTTLGDQYPNLEGKLFTMPLFAFDRSLITSGFAVALVAIIETMLSAKIADGMTKTKHDPRREMLGLGLANIASGLAGGIAATAALARTSLNIKSNATDKMSATISSVCVALISLLLLPYFSYIPLAAIAAILVFVAIRMVEMHHISHLWHHDRKHFAVAMVVAFVTVYEDPIVGILFGTGIALLLFVEDLSKGYFDVAMNDITTGKVKLYSGKTLSTLSEDSHILVYSMKGQLVYLNAQAHISRFERNLSKYYGVVIRMRELYYIDSDGVAALDEIITLIEQQGKPIYFTSVPKHIAVQLKRELKAYSRLKRAGQITEKTIDALSEMGYTPQPSS